MSAVAGYGCKSTRARDGCRGRAACSLSYPRPAFPSSPACNTLVPMADHNTFSPMAAPLSAALCYYWLTLCILRAGQPRFQVGACSGGSATQQTLLMMMILSSLYLYVQRHPADSAVAPRMPAQPRPM